MEENKKTVCQILETICNRFCAEYCKHGATIDGIKDEAERDEKIKQFCTDCPLNDIF